MAWLSDICVIDDLKITCLTVTKDRLELLKHAIDCYIAQTYINKDLLIASQSSDAVNANISAYLQILGRKDIRLFPIDPAVTLGEARRIASIEAYGDIVCQWDDDDHYHPKRLSTQYTEMIRNNAIACFYDSHLKLFKDEQSLYWIDWSIESDPWRRVLTGSVMFFKKHEGQYLNIVNFYPSKSCYEDADFAEKVFQTYPVSVSKHGYQYVYIYHGANVYDEVHHHRLLNSKRVLSVAEMCAKHSQITEAISGLGKLNVMGSEGLAFIV